MKYAKVPLSERLARMCLFALVVAPATGLVVGGIATPLMDGILDDTVEFDMAVLKEDVPRGMGHGAVAGLVLGILSGWAVGRHRLLRAWLIVTLPAAGLTLGLAPAFGVWSGLTGVLGYIMGWAALIGMSPRPLRDSPDYQDQGAERVIDDPDCYPPA